VIALPGAQMACRLPARMPQRAAATGGARRPGNWPGAAVPVRP